MYVCKLYIAHFKTRNVVDIEEMNQMNGRARGRERGGREAAWGWSLPRRSLSGSREWFGSMNRSQPPIRSVRGGGGGGTATARRRRRHPTTTANFPISTHVCLASSKGKGAI
ncbi:hypothetical protein O0L34_g7161 [Tuta absoluta]|nr:hypothetical protein O0L34_g7161 [Tuta absoluta]